VPSWRTVMVCAPGEDMQRILFHHPDIGGAPDAPCPGSGDRNTDRPADEGEEPMRQRRAIAVIIAVLCAVTALVGCTRSVDGRAVSIYDDPFKVAGLPTTSGPSGPRPDVPDSELTARNGDGGEVDTLALNAVEDIQEYW